MDFDDLVIQSSKAALERNPFEDPFARPRSPDPWASAYQQQPTEEDVISQTPPDETVPRQPSSPRLPVDSGPEGQVVEAAAHQHTPPPTSSTPSESSGSLSRPKVEGPSPVLPPVNSSSSAIEPSLSEQLPSSPPNQATVPLPFASATKFTSPLEVPQPVYSSFANLSLGGEAPGGSPWTSKPDPRHSSSSISDKPEVDGPGRVTADRLDPTDNQAVPEAVYFSITVDDPQKVGDPIRPYIMYTVHTRTNSTAFRKSAFSVLRRYSDFLWLFETLSLSNPGVIIPPIPEKSSFGRFEGQFVESRRAALNKCIQKITEHPILQQDQDMKLFLESDTFVYDIKQRKAEIAHERGGLVASIGQSISGPRFFEVDEWFDQKKVYLDGLESQLRSLVKTIDAVSKQQTDLATATGDLSTLLDEMAASDLSKPLVQSIRLLADVERKAREMRDAQSHSNVMVFLATVDEYARLINSVRLAFASRIRAYHSWQTADAEVRRVRQVQEKARRQGRVAPERIGQSVGEISGSVSPSSPSPPHSPSYSTRTSSPRPLSPSPFALHHAYKAERRAIEAKHDFESVGRLVKSEFERFEKERVDDFKRTLEDYLEKLISRQKNFIAALEAYQETLLRNAGSNPTIPPQDAIATAS